jgi:hypothetical protein
MNLRAHSSFAVPHLYDFMVRCLRHLSAAIVVVVVAVEHYYYYYYYYYYYSFERMKQFKCL